jgi:hypothetical protein
MRNAPQTAFNRENWMIDLNHTLSNTKSRSYPKAFPLTTANLGVSDHALKAADFPNLAFGAEDMTPVALGSATQ